MRGIFWMNMRRQGSIPVSYTHLRSEVAAFQNDESDNILDFVSVDEYRKMEDELKKAYQYFEWNDRSGAYRYYEEIQKKEMCIRDRVDMRYGLM